jgi:hypothetical protein
MYSLLTLYVNPFRKQKGSTQFSKGRETDEKVWRIIFSQASPSRLGLAIHPSVSIDQFAYEYQVCLQNGLALLVFGIIEMV